MHVPFRTALLTSVIVQQSPSIPELARVITDAAIQHAVEPADAAVVTDRPLIVLSSFRKLLAPGNTVTVFDEQAVRAAIGRGNRSIPSNSPLADCVGPLRVKIDICRMFDDAVQVAVDEVSRTPDWLAVTVVVHADRHDDGDTYRVMVSTVRMEVVQRAGRWTVASRETLDEHVLEAFVVSP